MGVGVHCALYLSFLSVLLHVLCCYQFSIWCAAQFEIIVRMYKCICIRHSDGPFFKDIVQVTVPLSKFRNYSSFFSGTVTFHSPFSVPFTFTKCEISPAPASPHLYILTVILLYFSAVLNYLILFYYNIT